MSEMRKKVLNVISKAALVNARKEANSACVLFGYQPKISENAKEKLKRKK